MHALTSALAASTAKPAATSAQIGGVVDVFLQFGVLGALVLVGLFFFNRVWKEQQARAERAETALAELNRDLRDKVVPVLATVAAVLKDAERAIVERRDRG